MNEKIALHTDSWDSIVRTLREDGNPTAETIANTIEAQRTTALGTFGTSSKVAVGFCGLPGAGKSYAVQLLEDLIGDTEEVGEAISMGDAIRDRFVKENNFVTDGDGKPIGPEHSIKSEDLADFAAEKRAEDAAQIPAWVTDLSTESDAGVIAIDGVRSITDYEVLNRYFDKFLLVHIEAPFYERLDRLNERGREGEDEFDAGDLVDRDRHELEQLGQADLLNHEDEWAEEYLPDDTDANFNKKLVDAVIENNSGVWKLRRGLLEVLHSQDWLPSPEKKLPPVSRPP